MFRAGPWKALDVVLHRPRLHGPLQAKSGIELEEPVVGTDVHPARYAVDGDVLERDSLVGGGPGLDDYAAVVLGRRGPRQAEDGPQDAPPPPAADSPLERGLAPAVAPRPTWDKVHVYALKHWPSTPVISSATYRNKKYEVSICNFKLSPEVV